MTLLAILTPQEKRQFDLPPAFNQDERTVYFSLTPAMKRLVSRMENNNTRAGFLLQLAYFRANARFYPVDSFKKRDIQYIQALLQCKDINLNRYQSAVMSRHRRKILTMLGWTLYGSEERETLTNYAIRQAKNQVKPKQIFVGLVDLCWKHRINIPTYTELNEIITNCFNETESSILTELETLLTDQQCQQLETLLLPGMKVGTRSQPGITELKKINQGLRPGEIQENIKTLSVIKEHFKGVSSTR